MTVSVTSEVFSTDDFAQAATFWATSGSGAGTTVSVVFDSGELLASFGESSFDDQLTYIYVQDSEVPSISHSSVFLISGTVYFVREINPDGTGVSTIKLTKDKVRL